MHAISIDGRALAKRYHEQIRGDAERAEAQLGRKPRLAVVLVGENPASKVYVASKSKTAKSCGIEPIDITLPTETPQHELDGVLQKLSSDPTVDGILLQLPLPKHLDEFRALSQIAPLADADGLHPFNQGLLVRGAEGLRPCTPLGCMALIDQARAELGLSHDLSGLHAVVVGRSVLVGKPVALLLLERNCTVTVAHSRTADLAAQCLQADILVAAVGKPEFIPGEWVKPGAVVIDVGINRLADGRLVGDVHFDSAANRAAAITPVPGGVGPMTIAMLLWNTVQAALKKG